MKNSIRIIQVDDINIGKNIKELRIKRKLTQTDILAKLQLKGLQVSVYSLSKIENGRQNPTVSLLCALTEILDCDFNALFDHHPNP